MNPRSTDYNVDALTTAPLRRVEKNCNFACGNGRIKLSYAFKLTLGVKTGLLLTTTTFGHLQKRNLSLQSSKFSVHPVFDREEQLLSVGNILR